MSEDLELWKVRAELRKAARELVDRTMVDVRDPQTKTTSTKRAKPLLEQLRDAVSNAGGAGGKRAGTGSPELVSLAALTLLRQIEFELLTMHVQAVRDQSFTVEERIRTVVAMTNRRADVATTTSSTARLAAMAEQIRDLLDPAKQLDVVAPCPVCGRRTVWREVAGEQVQASALSLDVASGRCVCLSCEASWQPQHLELLLRMIRDAEQQRQAVEDRAARELRSGVEGSTGRMPPGTQRCAGKCGEVKLVEQFALRPDPTHPRLRVRATICVLCARAQRAEKPTNTTRHHSDGDGQVA